MSEVIERDANGIYADSGFRLPLPSEDGSAESEAAFKGFASLANDPKRGKAGPSVGLRGPGGIVLYSPEFARLNAATNMYLRFDAGIDGRLRELAILVAAREVNNQFEFCGHEPMARAEGLEPEIIDIVRFRRPTDGLDERDATIIALGREAVGDRKVTLATFDAALRLFGERMLVDLSGLMGSYVATAILLDVFDIQLREGWEPLLPDL